MRKNLKFDKNNQNNFMINKSFYSTCLLEEYFNFITNRIKDNKSLKISEIYEYWNRIIENHFKKNNQKDNLKLYSTLNFFVINLIEEEFIKQSLDYKLKSPKRFLTSTFQYLLSCNCYELNEDCIDNIPLKTILNDIFVYYVANNYDYFVLREILLEFKNEGYKDFERELEKIVKNVVRKKNLFNTYYRLSDDEKLTENNLIEGIIEKVKKDFIPNIDINKLNSKILRKEYTYKILKEIYTISLGRFFSLITNNTLGRFHLMFQDMTKFNLYSEQSNIYKSIFKNFVKQIKNENQNSIYYIITFFNDYNISRENIISNNEFNFTFWSVGRGITEIFIKEKYKEFSLLKEYFLIFNELDFKVENLEKLYNLLRELSKKHEKLNIRFSFNQFRNFIQKYISDEFTLSFELLYKFVYEILFWILTIKEFGYQFAFDLFINWYMEFFNFYENIFNNNNHSKKHNRLSLDIYYQILFLTLNEFIFSYKPEYYDYEKINILNIENSHFKLEELEGIKERLNTIKDLSLKYKGTFIFRDYINKMINVFSKFDQLKEDIEELYYDEEEKIAVINEDGEEKDLFEFYENKNFRNPIYYINLLYNLFENNYMINKLKNSIYLTHYLKYTTHLDVINFIDLILIQLDSIDLEIETDTLIENLEYVALDELIKITSIKKLPFILTDLKVKECKNKDKEEYKPYISLIPFIIREQHYTKSDLKLFYDYIKTLNSFIS